ncbi:hypothetical protein [Psychroflexus planctonicus]|uniref:Uncharacterized protein n=1 Tax=Psychroflexus planctonicus TaxID=1526575 RepID=A0ABQ1SMZ7_9FLAO|nr:hypothetical protein [Psychroflexus planctonicus]GGE44518.1 hypothetical protein GCM10010832_25680 [Psychroflexus planctonicus]
MRFVILSIVCFILISAKSTAQINDLTDLSTGEFVSFQALFDYDDNLFGYVAQFNLGEIEKRVNSFEFVVYDKNLNRLLVEQVTGDDVVKKYNYDLNKDGKLIVSPEFDFSDINVFQAMNINKNASYRKLLEVNLNSGTVSDYKPPIYFAGELMLDYSSMDNKTLNKKMKAHKREIKFYEQGVTEVLENGKFLVKTRRTKDFQSFTDFQIKLFDENKKELWSYEYNVKSKRNKYEEIGILDYSDKQISFIQKNVKKKNVDLFFKVIDAETGKIIAEQKIENINSTGLNHLLSSKSNLMKRSNDEHTVLSAAIIEDKKDDVSGFFVAKINTNTNQLQYNVIDFNKDLSVLIDDEIKKNGSIDGHHLYPRDILLKDDGSFKLIGELTKYDLNDGNVNIKSVEDLYVLDFNSDLKLQSVDVIEKTEQKQKRPNYLFSRKLSDDSDDLVFFYRDFIENEETGDENWILYINTYKDNKLTQDQLKLTSKNEGFEIYPFVAKKGFILLHEFDENEEHNQVRLERLNVY